MSLEQTLVKLSSKRTSRNSFIWSFGVDRTLYDGLPENKRRVKINNINNALVVQLGDTGSKLSINTNTSTVWASVSALYLTNFNPPNAHLPSLELPAVFDDEKLQITFPEAKLPELIQKAMRGELQRSTVKMHKVESTRFASTLVKQPEAPIANVPVIEKSMNLLEAEQTVTWSDVNVKRLKFLIKSLQETRSDIVFVTENGVTTLKRRVLEDF